MSVKDKLDKWINHISANGHTISTSDILQTLTLAKQRIEKLEERNAITLTARDQIALAMLPGTAGIDDPGEAMGAAFKAADLFIEASKEVQP